MRPFPRALAAHARGRPLDLDVVQELERIVQRLGLGAGQVTVEAVFADGSYMRGFVKQGPLTAQQMRELGTIG